MSRTKKKVFHMFGAIGGGARGFKRARVLLGQAQGEWECMGSVDVDAAANRVFARRIGVPATTLDLADRAQYIAINGREPPPGWREATPADIRSAATGHRPDCIFLSAPCQGLSGLLPAAKAATPKYVAMNGLSERGLWLALEAWADDPVPIILFENVPRLLTRGRAFADQVIAMMQAFGYATRETVHDCGKLGRLGQSRKRCLIVARHITKVPNFLYEPPQRPLRSVGEVLGKLWLPGEDAAGPMHRVPSLQWKTWVRLAFVEAGSDWRSLNKLAVQDGVLRDYLLMPEDPESWHRNVLGVTPWTEPAHTVTGESRPSTGRFSVADPRASSSREGSGFLGVRDWDEPTGAVTGNGRPGAGGKGVQGGWLSVADPRPNTEGRLFTKYPVTAWGSNSGTVIGGDDTGAYAVADPRTGMTGDREAYLTGGHYGVLRLDQTSGAVSAAACHDNGKFSIADPRMPVATDKLVARIRALDGTWHRPFTTLELSALQSLFDPEDPADCAAFTDAYLGESKSDGMHRTWTGNSVPPDAAEAIATEILRTLMLADAGETFQLSATPVWVRPVIAGLSLAGDVS